MIDRKITLKIILPLLIIGLSFVAAYFFLYPRYQEYQKAKKEKQELDRLIESIVFQWKIETKFIDYQVILDMNGDGIPERLVNMPMRLRDDYSPETPFLSVYNYNGEEIGKTPEWLGPTPPAFEMQSYKLNTNDPREYLAVEFTVGPHQSETMFFGLNKDTLLPVCFVAQPNDPYDCLFYAGNVGELIVEDLDDNGFMDVVEIIDEYPSDGQLDKEEKAAITKVFNEYGDTEFTQAAERIAIREKGGRGREVVWAIYSYNGEYFEPQLDQAYNKFFTLLIKDNSILMKRSEMSPDSIVYAEFVRNAWSHRQ